MTPEQYHKINAYKVATVIKAMVVYHSRPNNPAQWKQAIVETMGVHHYSERQSLTNMLNSMFATLYVSWPGFSGDYMYPIKDPDQGERTAQDAWIERSGRKGNDWGTRDGESWDSLYGQLVTSLLLHLLTELKKEVAL
jgi:hypothetical protein